jgi:methyl-accepting chemotaxis protein
MRHAPIDFSQARFKHLNWKFRIRNFLDGKETLTQEQAISHKRCDLGKWFYADGKSKYGHLKEMQEFEIEHEKLHRIVQTIVGLKEKENTSEAEQAYFELLAISDKIIFYLTEAEKIINHGADLSQKKMTVGA